MSEFCATELSKKKYSMSLNEKFALFHLLKASIFDNC